MKAGYIETQLDSESPDVSRKGRHERREPSRCKRAAGGLATQTQ